MNEYIFWKALTNDIYSKFDKLDSIQQTRVGSFISTKSLDLENKCSIRNVISVFVTTFSLHIMCLNMTILEHANDYGCKVVFFILILKGNGIIKKYGTDEYIKKFVSRKSFMLY